ncbi:glycosyltransferase family 4 protein [Terriglobus saanensis]|uniref:Glycosyl transferase group 1 n=1 Tax=Terriglobus saanensis (strain ATCC BAA-1853 / DSM 23119 / SP1PR4) TaxID=401053 RepID=E8UZE3_TERSS|nr:glycosyltransferase family 1 protein [Terriglobus saanensis]ADV83223.1 glycosyl transferase group 1 [Terriglobus saanensis SP1PR4]
MKVLLIGNYASDRQESMLRFGNLLQRELESRGHEVTLLQPPERLGSTTLLGSGMRKWFGYVDKFLLFPRQLRRVKRQFEVVHICDHSNAMYVKHLQDRPHVVTCHDMLAIKSAAGEVPENPTSFSGRVFQRLILSGIKQAQNVVCVSEATRNDLARISGRAPSKIAVIYNGLNYPYTPMPAEEARRQLKNLGLQTSQPYFVHIGGTVWYKNKLGLLKIYASLREYPEFKQHRLLLLGKPLSSVLVDFVRESGLEPFVDKKSNVSNEDLRAAYSLSEGLIFPSLQEGFGWPVLEAQASGCCVFTTNRKPMTEVGGDAAVYFDPSDVPGAARAIKDALQEKAAMQLRGLANAQKFSTERMIEQYVAEYSLAIQQQQTSPSLKKLRS